MRYFLLILQAERERSAGLRRWGDQEIENLFPDKVTDYTEGSHGLVMGIIFSPCSIQLHLENPSI